MRIFRFFILICITGVIFTACGDELSLSATELSFSEDSGSYEVVVTSTESWSVKVPDDWLIVSPMMGNRTGTIKISVFANNGQSNRASYVKISTKSNSKFVKITQTYAKNVKNEKENNDSFIQGNVLIENGALKAAFSVSNTQQVFFSQGNLQYLPRSNLWRFAEHQFDTIGVANSSISSTYTGWIDLFGYGTSGAKYSPTLQSINNDDYENGSIANTDNDWGIYNKIVNGGDQSEEWRTLTKDEWLYIIESRENAKNKYGLACVNGVNGLILLPDSWIQPRDLTFTCGVSDYLRHSFKSVNNYTLSDWEKMEANGAVFLPAAGFRYGSDVDLVNYIGHYWSSFADGSIVVGALFFDSEKVSVGVDFHLYGNSVRLVQNVK